MTAQTALLTRQFRLAVIASLSGPEFLGVNIYSPGDWSTPSTKLPAILVRATSEGKDSVNVGRSEFNTGQIVELDLRVSEPTGEDAQDALEAILFNVQQSIFTNQALAAMGQILSVQRADDYTAEGAGHIGASKMAVTFKAFEYFDSDTDEIAVPLTSMGIHVDSLGTFDAAGTYANPPFPASVTAAPRTSGPDGRDEGTLEITLPQ
ncbi:MAG: hypothetical protein JWR21_879 [Herminiimonas sp.]|nr:hypothetical protein [Herminiimonas sp.]